MLYTLICYIGGFLIGIVIDKIKKQIVQITYRSTVKTLCWKKEWHHLNDSYLVKFMDWVVV